MNVPLLGAVRRARDLGLDPADIDRLHGRAVAAETDGSFAVRAFRFHDDSLSPRKHSTLTGQHTSREAIVEVIAFLNERLLPRPA